MDFVWTIRFQNSLEKNVHLLISISLLYCIDYIFYFRIRYFPWFRKKKEIRKYFMKSRKVEYLSYSWKQLYKMKLNLQLIIKMKENPLLVYFLQEHLPFLFKSFQVYDILILKTHFTFYVPDSTRVFRQKNQASRDPAINLKNFRKKQV